ncbi:MAG TPA: MotA/TolQ/ExbB proton channel family protein [Polyangiaceae bacterium]|nr:MotA/TolQ/ExbB proton channel family protein [Polyangiaceae bacterium]
MLIERLMKVALLGSAWVLYLLIGLSVLSFSVMLERWWFLRKRRDDLVTLRRRVVERLVEQDWAGADDVLGKSQSLEARVVRKALNFRGGGSHAMTDGMESELLLVRKELERGLTLLGTLGNNAPFVGLFGTVLGVIIAFHALGAAGKNTSQMGGVMAGIAEALVATGVGLFVALPAVVAYNVIQKRIADIESDAQSLTKLLTAYVKTQGHKHGFKASAVSSTQNGVGAGELEDLEAPALS